MRIDRSERGFGALVHQTRTPPCEEKPLLIQSSAIGDDDDAFDRPGSSYLWVGDDHCLNRHEVTQLVQHLQAWLDTGDLEPGIPRKDDRPGGPPAEA